MKRCKHKSFGKISINRCYAGNKHRLFGSDIDNPSFITLTISPAELEIDDITGEERIHQDGISYIEVEMSSLQFADMIMNHNVNDGVPCTIRRIGGEYIQNFGKETPKGKGERLQDFYREKMTNFAQTFDDKSNKIKELLKKKYLTIEEKEEVSRLIDSLQSNLKSNFPFYLEMFQEQTSKVILQAKTELDSVLLCKVTRKVFADDDLQGVQAFLDERNKISGYEWKKFII